MARITINGVSFDPMVTSQPFAGASAGAPDPTGSRYVLIQTRDPLAADHRAELSSLGVVIHEYVPQDTYICGYPSGDLEAIRALPFVVWADVYLRGFKVPPSLRPPRPDPNASIGPAYLPASTSRRLREVDVVLHDDVDPGSEDLRARIAGAAGLQVADLQMGRRKVRLTVEEGRLEQLAELDDVRHIEEVPRRQLFNNVARPILGADVALNGTPYRGDGQLVAVADTGFDLGSTTDVHPAFAGRVSKLYALGRTTPNRTNDPNGHGTHVAGSALGNGNSATMGGPIQGTAPNATLVLQSLLDPAGGLGGIPVDLRDLFEPPYADGCRVHTNSWGATLPGLPYDASASEIDAMVWDHPDLVICFAAGNEGTDGNRNGVVDDGSVGSQSAAKNCITVGASESNRDFGASYGQYWPSDFPTDPINSDRQADNPDGLVAFSSRGPTRELRFKPDVVAPGTCILSTRSRAVAMVPTQFGTSSDPLFFFLSGTSMATPLVAGCVAVLRETLVKNGTPNPSAALLKALLVNGAFELPGQYSPSETGPAPNNNSGFGRVNLAASVIVAGPDADGGFGEGGPLQQGEEDTIAIEIPGRPGVAFRVTLVWSDPPGAALQNDLDLVVRASDGQERHGNMRAAQGFDRRNNVEKVVWTNMPPGRAELVVRAFRITRFAQPYAYAWRIG